MTRPLSEEVYVNRLTGLVDAIFANPRSYSPFLPHLKPRALVFPCIYQFDEDLYVAFRSALTAIGEKQFYLTYTERVRPESSAETKSAWRSVPFHWNVDVTDTEGYYAASAELLESILYSESCVWGVQCSGADYAMFAGPDMFIDVLRRKLPKERSDPTEFVRSVESMHQAHGTAVSWVYEVAEHVRASEDAGA